MIMKYDKIKIEIDERVENLIKSIDEELDGKQEFNGYLVAKKENVWRIVDLIIPEQKVSGASVEEKPGKEKASQYEEQFVKVLKENDDKVIIGTMHSHNSMGSFHSSTDDLDVDDHAYLNLNEGLPFIDIVWSHKDTKIWVTMKFNGGGKQSFTVEPEKVEFEIIKTNDKESIIKDIKEKYSQYEIDEEILEKAISKKIDVKDIVKNIEVRKSYNKGLDGFLGYSGNAKYDPTEPKLHIEHHKKSKCAMIVIKNDPDNYFSENLKAYIKENKKKIIKADSSGRAYRLFIECENKQEFKEIEEEIEEIWEDFMIGWESVVEENLYNPGRYYIG